jgi:MYXO-CTERM domain-containing protein
MGGMADRPDFLDGDSDNDCLPDSDSREAGAARTNPALPSTMAGANCPGEGAMCDVTRGVCVAGPPPDAGPDAALDASAPDVTAPDVSAPDVSAPDVSAPDVSVLDASVLDASATDASIDLGTLDSGPPTQVTYRGGGCGCGVPGRAPRTSLPASLLALGALLALRRRRR